MARPNPTQAAPPPELLGDEALWSRVNGARLGGFTILVLVIAAVPGIGPGRWPAVGLLLTIGLGYQVLLVLTYRRTGRPSHLSPWVDVVACAVLPLVAAGTYPIALMASLAMVALTQAWRGRKVAVIAEVLTVTAFAAVALLRDPPGAWPSLAGQVVTAFWMIWGIGQIATVDRQSIRRFAALVDGLEAVVWEADLATRSLTYVSHAADQFGHPRWAWTEGSGLAGLMADEDSRRLLDAMWDGLDQGHEHATRLRVRTADGGAVLVHVQASRPVAGHVRGLVVDVGDQQRLVNELEHLANHDPLTGLANRRAYDEALTYALEEADARGDTVGLLVLDLDQFKAVNDHHGHEVGDDLLARVALALDGRVRRTDLLARIGGDEFAVICPQDVTPAGLLALAHDLVDAVGTVVADRGLAVDVGVSIGVATYPDPAGDGESLRRLADKAMYGAKRSGSAVWLAELAD